MSPCKTCGSHCSVSFGRKTKISVPAGGCKQRPDIFHCCCCLFTEKGTFKYRLQGPVLPNLMLNAGADSKLNSNLSKIQRTYQKDCVSGIKRGSAIDPKVELVSIAAFGSSLKRRPTTRQFIVWSFKSYKMCVGSISNNMYHIIERLLVVTVGGRNIWREKLGVNTPICSKRGPSCIQNKQKKTPPSAL